MSNALIWYVSPGEQDADGFIGPFGVGNRRDSWAKVVWSAGSRYYQKAGTVSTGGISPNAEHVLIGAYGDGRAILDASSVNAGVLVYQRAHVTVENIESRSAKVSGFQFSPSGAGHRLLSCVAKEFGIYGVIARGITGMLVDGFEASSSVPDYKCGVAYEDGCTGGEIRSARIHDIGRGDGIMVRKSSGVMVRRNALYGWMGDSLALEDAHACLVEGNTIIQEGLQGPSYPALKLGNDFDTGVGANYNIIRGNRIASSPLCSWPIQAYKVGANNLIDGNTYSEGVVFAWNSGADGVATANYTFEQFKALGRYEQVGQCGMAAYL